MVDQLRNKSIFLLSVALLLSVGLASCQKNMGSLEKRKHKLEKKKKRNPDDCPQLDC